MLKGRILLLKERFRGYFLYLVVLILLLLTISLVRNILRVSQAGDREKIVGGRVENLKEENEKLKNELEKIESEAYVEFQARDKLGLAKEGEIIVVLPDDEILRKIAPLIEEEEESLPDPTWKKWIHLFGF